MLQSSFMSSQYQHLTHARTHLYDLCVSWRLKSTIIQLQSLLRSNQLTHHSASSDRVLTSPATCSNTACTSPFHHVALSPWSSTPDSTTYGSGRKISQLVLTNLLRPSDRVMLRMISVFVFRWRNNLQPS